MQVRRRRRSTPETAVVKEALVDPTLDFVGDVPAGEAEVKSDVVLRPALAPLQDIPEQPAEWTGLGNGARRLGVGETGGVGEDGHRDLLFWAMSE
jgi:hypothetical protein